MTTRALLVGGNRCYIHSNQKMLIVYLSERQRLLTLPFGKLGVELPLLDLKNFQKSNSF